MGRLTVGLGLFTGQRPAGATRPPYADAPALAAAAETAGFDTFWVSEHHGWDDDYLPAPLTLLAAVAARTTRIRLGAGLALAPLYHPVALAEQAAVVDQLSDGRLDLGLGLGYVDAEFQGFGVQRRGRGRRLEDTIGFLRAAWSGEPARWTDADGAGHLAVVTPRPVQSRVPIWLGGYADRAVERAARLGDGHLIGRGDPAVVERTLGILDRIREPRDPTFTVGVNLVTVIDDETSSAVRQAFARQQAAYERRQRRDDPYGGRIAVEGERALALGNIDEYIHAHGTPSAVAQTLLELLEPLRGRADVHVVLRILFPEPDLGPQLNRIERAGMQVVPVLRDAWDQVDP